MAFLPDYCEKLTHHDRIRYEKKIEVCGCNPFDLVFDSLSDDKEEWPRVTDVDRMEYLVFRTNFTTREAMKNFKSLEAHNFVTSGLVFPPRSQKVSGERVLLLGKVHHSQRHTQQPLKLWILAENDGNIITGHCSCMAGCNETCSHVAANIYLLEFAAKAKETITCTDQQCGWLPPTMSAVPAKEIREIDFISSNARLRRLEALVAGEVPSTPTSMRRRCLSLESVASQKWNSTFLAALAEANPIAVGLSSQRDLCTPFKNPPTSPLDLTKLYDHTSLDLTYSKVLKKCKNIMNEMKISKAEIENIEQKTRKQANSIVWHLYRLGRITGSMMFKVWQGNINNPAKSTWEVICKGKSGSEESQRRKSLNRDICRGRDNEACARNEYETNQRKTHRNFIISLVGLVIHPDYPFIGSSPDGHIRCDCCPGFGCLEVKCPREENLTDCLDTNGELKQDHSYYFQVQSHMLEIIAIYISGLVLKTLRAHYQIKN